MYSTETLDELLKLCGGEPPFSPAQYREAENALTLADGQRELEGEIILSPWQAYAVQQLLAQAEFSDPCVEEFTKAVPTELRPPGMRVRTG